MLLAARKLLEDCVCACSVAAAVLLVSDGRFELDPDETAPGVWAVPVREGLRGTCSASVEPVWPTPESPLPCGPPRAWPWPAAVAGAAEEPLMTVIEEELEVEDSCSDLDLESGGGTRLPDVTL